MILSRFHRSRRGEGALAGASLVALAIALSACAGGEPPTTQLEVARQAVADASRNGAADRAPQSYIAAREKLARAEEASKGKEYDDARRFAEQAAADARLAGAQARTAAAEEAVAQVRAGNMTLQPRAPLPAAGSSTVPSGTGVSR